LLSYVEVHPCDTYFRVKNTKVYKPIISQRANSEQFSFKECKEQKAAVAWFVGDKDTITKCVPLPSEITETGLETGLCLELNTAVELRRYA
jgi:hypothetical protein